MTPTPPHDQSRRVLLWRADTDESHTEPTIDAAAGFLKVAAAQILAAIASGDVLQGWFVDWEVPSRSPASVK